MALQFTRNATVYVELVDGSGTHVEAWKLSVLDGFSFTQSINSSEITISEAGTTSRRARLLFNDSLSSCRVVHEHLCSSLYVDATALVLPEDVLWAMAMGASDFAIATDVSFWREAQLNTVVRRRRY